MTQRGLNCCLELVPKVSSLLLNRRWTGSQLVSGSSVSRLDTVSGATEQHLKGVLPQRGLNCCPELVPKVSSPLLNRRWTGSQPVSGSSVSRPYAASGTTEQHFSWGFASEVLKLPSFACSQLVQAVAQHKGGQFFTTSLRVLIGETIHSIWGYRAASELGFSTFGVYIITLTPLSE